MMLAVGKLVGIKKTITRSIILDKTPTQRLLLCKQENHNYYKYKLYISRPKLASKNNSTGSCCWKTNIGIWPVWARVLAS